MEISDFSDSGVESVSDRELGFDFLAKQSQNSNSVAELDNEKDVGVTEQSFNNGAVEDEDDGFQTPTSIDMRIKMIDTCPPAPRKPPPPPPSRKRKALFPLDQSAMVADLAAEIAKLSPEKKARILTAPAAVK
ncbi:hypothetical protein QQ045_032738 [Rhodiola kirilowii]